MSQPKRLARQAIEALGQGFDVTNDFRLKYCKKHLGSQLIHLDHQNLQTLSIPGGQEIPNVSKDIKCDKGERTRFKSDILDFDKMSELFNQRSGMSGKIPSGNFNVMFGLTGSWMTDASETKSLGFDGFMISLYNLHLTKTQLTLKDEVKQAVSPSWDPEGIARFIETYGTHVVVGVEVGGMNIILVKQDYSSNLEPLELKQHLEKVGDQVFLGMCSRPTGKYKSSAGKVPDAFRYLFEPTTHPTDSFSSASNKDGLTVISSKRGGTFSLTNHSDWLATVPSYPEAIKLKFMPITSFLTGIPGHGFLNQAINLYLRYKPPIEDLRHFLEFQVHLVWAPLHNELPLGPPRKKKLDTAIQFSFMGPKIHVSGDQVKVGRTLITGIRLYLEGKKCDRLAIHLQHLSTTPKVLQPFWNPSTFRESSKWRGSDDQNRKYFEAVQWKNFSYVCTYPIKYDPNWVTEHGGVCVVTGAQLDVQGSGSKKVLHLKLLFTRIPNCSIQKSVWEQGSSLSQKSSILSTLSTTFSASKPKQKAPDVILNSAVYAKGPPVPVQAPKRLKFVDTSEIVKGPQDTPGHWVLTAARLGVEGGKITIEGKFSILNYPA